MSTGGAAAAATRGAGKVNLLEDLYVYGAEAPYFLEQRYGSLVEPLERGYLALIETPAGRLAVLGPRGRPVFGLRPNYRTTPDKAADQYVQRRCVALLVERGWNRLGRRGQWPCLRESASGRVAYLLARWRPISTRLVRHSLTTLRERLIHERATLFVHTTQPKRLMRLVEREKVIGLLYFGDRNGRTLVSNETLEGKTLYGQAKD